MLSAVRGRANAWMFADGSADRLAVVRIGLAGVIAVRIASHSWTGYGGQPSALFRPMSFMHVFSAMPGQGSIQAVQVLGLVAAVAACIGLAPRVTLPVAWAALLFLGGVATSTGKIMHNEVTLLLATFPLLAAPIGDRLCVWPRRRVTRPAWAYGWPVRAATVVVAGAYLFTGLRKLVTAGPAWALSDNLRWVVIAGSRVHPPTGLSAMLLAAPTALVMLLAASILLLEVTFPVVLWRPRAALFYVPAMIMLHLGIAWTLHLDYTAWIAVDVIVFTPWDALLARGFIRLPAVSGRRLGAAAPLDGPHSTR